MINSRVNPCGLTRFFVKENSSGIPISISRESRTQRKEKTMEILYILSVIILAVAFMLFKKSEEKLNFIKWLIIYIFVLTSYFKFEPNYLSKRVSQILANLEASDYAINDIIETIPAR